MIRLVVFDMAGTTVHDDDAVNHCLGQALCAAGIWVSRDAINAVMGIPKPIAIEQLIAGVRPPEPSEARRACVQAVHEDFMRRMTDFYRTGSAVREVEGASTLFRALQTRGVICALDTGFDRRTADTVLDRLGWIPAGLIDVTVTSDEVERGRPAPDMIVRAMSLAGISHAWDVAKVGDTPSDLEEGTAAGCRLVVGFTSGTHTREQLEVAPHTHLIARLRDLLAIIDQASPEGPRVRAI
jgi:phosphonatase-like hydrolase